MEKLLAIFRRRFDLRFSQRGQTQGFSLTQLMILVFNFRVTPYVIRSLFFRHDFEPNLLENDPRRSRRCPN